MGTYYLIGIIALVGSLLIQGWLKSTYGKWSRKANTAGLTGAEVARALLQANGINDVSIEPVRGQLSDHYDPGKKVVRLSEGIYGHASVAGMAVAAHEVGHAIQHASGYQALRVRTALLPLASIGSQFGPLIAVFGLMLSATGLLKIGIWLFAAAVLFQLVTLPIEFDASRRALATRQQLGLATQTDRSGARSLLTAAAMTYVAAAATAIAYFLYFLSAARD